MNKKAELLLKYANQAPLGLFVEIGCIRHEIEDEDGWSTLYLAKYCSDRNKQFMSFDNDLESVRIANAVLQNNNLPQCVSHKDGTKAIEGVNCYAISYLLLDSHKNPSFSFEQYKAAELVPGAVLIVDDAQKIDDWSYGKADFIQKIFYKQRREYEIIETIPGWSSFVAILPNGKKYGEL